MNTQTLSTFLRNGLLSLLVALGALSATPTALAYDEPNPMVYANTSIAAWPVQVRPGQQATLTGSVSAQWRTDKKRPNLYWKPLPGAEVYFEACVNNHWVGVGSARTDAQGVASLGINVDKRFKPGTKIPYRAYFPAQTVKPAGHKDAHVFRAVRDAGVVKIVR